MNWCVWAINIVRVDTCDWTICTSHVAALEVAIGRHLEKSVEVHRVGNRIDLEEYSISNVRENKKPTLV